MSPQYPWHQALWDQVAAARAGQRLPHALLLAGPAGLGKAAFARRLAGALVCHRPGDRGDACGSCPACRQAAAGSHPDLRVVGPDQTGKMIKIDAIRELSAKSVLAAEADGHRVFVIDPAEAMNRAAANALLKTLEEPAARSVLILVSSLPDRLPATIRSRCQVLRFAIPQAHQVRDWLAEAVATDQVDDLLALGSGAPLRALQARDEGWLDEDRRLCQELSALQGRQKNPIQIVEEWQKRPLTLVLDGLKRCLSDLVRLESGLAEAAIFHPALKDELQSLGRGIELKSLFEFGDDLLHVDRNQSHNLNVQMVLENIAHRWLQITRRGGG